MQVNADYIMRPQSSDKHKVSTDRKVFCLMEDNYGKFKTKIMSTFSQFISESICMTTSK
jgi:hypothetical protein